MLEGCGGDQGGVCSTWLRGVSALAPGEGERQAGGEETSLLVPSSPDSSVTGERSVWQRPAVIWPRTHQTRTSKEAGLGNGRRIKQKMPGCEWGDREKNEDRAYKLMGECRLARLQWVHWWLIRKSEIKYWEETRSHCCYWHHNWQYFWQIDSVL